MPPESTSTNRPAPATISRSSVGLRSERGPVLLAVMLSIGLVAIDATILATAVPSVVKDLGGFSQFPWLFSVYLLAQAATVPIYGKLSDVYGRKTIILVGIGLFLLGSVLSGFAWNMTALIAFRAVQGLGAGAVQPTSMTIIGDIYSLAERAKVQGYVASVWAIAAVLGPTLGGVFVDFVSWRGIFFVNVPIGAVAIVFLVRRFHETSRPRRRHRLDIGGAILLVIGASAIILGLLEGGVIWTWLSWPSIAIFVGGIGVLVVFALVERRVSEPIMPSWVFGSRLLNTTNVTSLAIGVTLMGLTSYVPLYAQGVLGRSALVAGFALAAQTIGWPLAASRAGRLYLRIGFRNTALIGGSIALCGLVGLAFLSPNSPIWYVAIACFVNGLGMGLVASPTLIAAQTAFPREIRGVVTGTNMFARSIGSAVGIACFGAVVNATVGNHVGQVGGSALPAAQLAPALHKVFLAATGTAVGMLVAVALIPSKITESS